MIRTLARALVLTAALGTRAMASDSAPNDPKGVFAGTIGDAPIVAQFGGLPDDSRAELPRVASLGRKPKRMRCGCTRYDAQAL